MQANPNYPPGTTPQGQPQQANNYGHVGNPHHLQQQQLQNQQNQHHPSIRPGSTDGKLVNQPTGQQQQQGQMPNQNHMSHSTNAALASKLAAAHPSQVATGLSQQMPGSPAAQRQQPPHLTHKPDFNTNSNQKPSMNLNPNYHALVNNTSHSPHSQHPHQPHLMPLQQQQQQAQLYMKKEPVFPHDSVEAFQPVEVKKRKINSRDLSKSPYSMFIIMVTLNNTKCPKK